MFRLTLKNLYFYYYIMVSWNCQQERSADLVILTGMERRSLIRKGRVYKVEKYQKKRLTKGKPCDILCKLSGRQQA